MGVFALTIGSRLIARKGARLALNGIAALVLMSALAVDVYRQCEVKSAAFIPGENDPGVFFGGTYYFRHPNPQPYILTNPRRFDGIKLDVMDTAYWQNTDPGREAFAEWVTAHCRGPVESGGNGTDD
jgi:hypothetical protein